MFDDWTLVFGVIFTAALATSGGLLALAALQMRAKAANRTVFADLSAGTSFLFDGTTLIDATPCGRALLGLGLGSGCSWAKLIAYLTKRFPDFETKISHLCENGQFLLSLPIEHDEPLTVRAELRGGLTRIVLLDSDAAAQSTGVDPIVLRAIEQEISMLRDTVAKAPLLLWRENENGDVIWANAAYLMQATYHLEEGQDLVWPLPRLFERTASGADKAGQRFRLDTHGAASRWFEIIGFPDGTERLLFGIPADTVVRAEESLRDFMQTLTKTFAHLPIGLAIFDRQRQLALFNPALMDLSGLQPDFLSARPTLYAFLDAMRERNMIPEPKDYRTWRKQMTEIEKAASTGLYEETWTLPSGQTYRVIGRPHPNGAMALMFEDISTEISRTRRYRAELELGQAVLDAMEDGVAVFSQTGLLVMSNTVYSELWGHDPVAEMGADGIATLCEHWRKNSATSPLWAEAQAFVATVGERPAITGEARLMDGRLIDCRFSALPGGPTLATFTQKSHAAAAGPGFATARVRKSA